MKVFKLDFTERTVLFQYEINHTAINYVNNDSKIVNMINAILNDYGIEPLTELPREKGFKHFVSPQNNDIKVAIGVNAALDIRITAIEEPHLMWIEKQ